MVNNVPCKGRVPLNDLQGQSGRTAVHIVFNGPSSYIGRHFREVAMSRAVRCGGVLLLMVSLLGVQTFAFQAKSRGQRSGSGNSLIGAWEATEEGETVRLVFRSETLLEFDGEQSAYTIAGNVIRVKDPFEGTVDYRFSLKGNILSVTFPEGDQLVFHRAGQIPVASATPTSPTPGESPGSSQNYLLVGKFMSYSSASSSTGSSSWTTYATFDGKGNFEYSSESAHSSQQYDQTGTQTGSGVAYGASGANRGTYRVVGNRILVTFPDGSTGEAQITERFQDGSIGAFKYDGRTYAR